MTLHFVVRHDKSFPLHHFNLFPKSLRDISIRACNNIGRKFDLRGQSNCSANKDKTAALNDICVSACDKKSRVLTCEGALTSSQAAASCTIRELGPCSQSAVILASHPALSDLRGQGTSPSQALCQIGQLSILLNATDSCNYMGV